jgi:hypothetical protein
MYERLTAVRKDSIVLMYGRNALINSLPNKTDTKHPGMSLGDIYKRKKGCILQPFDLVGPAAGLEPATL